jgi:glutamyl-tRNA synthetase
MRFSVPDESICVEDHWAGRVCQHLPSEVGDFVVQRKDGVMAYHLAVVVDDALQEVTEVVRGRDLLSSSPRQVSLFRALGYPEPNFAHLPLWVDESGHRLAKRRGDKTLRALLQQESAELVLSRVGCVLGVCEKGEPLTLEALLQRMDDDMGRSEIVSSANEGSFTPIQ